MTHSTQAQPAIPADFKAVLICARDQSADPSAVEAALGGAQGLARLAATATRYGGAKAAPINAAYHLPNEALERFEQHCVLGWTRLKRPSLLGLACALLADRDIDVADLAAGPQNLSPREQALARALLLVAARAEENRGGRNNAYHNPLHTAHVAVAASYLADLNDHLAEGYGRFVDYTIGDKLTIILAAFAHDIDHTGRPNPAGDPLHNENMALEAVRPLMVAAGVIPRDLERLETMIRATSPDGPHRVLRNIARNHAHRELVPANATEKCPELAALPADKELTQMAAVLADADIFASVGSIAGCTLTAQRLTDEYRRAGLSADFTTPQARAGFIAHVVGRDGFTSQPAMAGFNRSYRNFVAANDALLLKPR